MQGLYKPKKKKEIVIPRNIISYDPFEYLAKENNNLLKDLKNYNNLEPTQQQLFDDLYTKLQIATEEKIGNDHDFNVQFDNLEKYLQQYEDPDLKLHKLKKESLKNRISSADNPSGDNQRKISQKNQKLNAVQRYKLNRNIQKDVIQDMDTQENKVKVVKMKNIPSKPQSQQSLYQHLQQQQQFLEYQLQQEEEKQNLNKKNKDQSPKTQKNKQLHIEKMAHTLKDMDKTIYNQGRKYFSKGIFDYAQSYDKLKNRNYDFVFNNPKVKHELEKSRSLSPQHSFYLSIYSNNSNNNNDNSGNGEGYSSENMDNISVESLGNFKTNNNLKYFNPVKYDANQFIYSNNLTSRDTIQESEQSLPKSSKQLIQPVAYTKNNQEMKRIEQSNRRITLQFSKTLQKNSIEFKLPRQSLIQPQNMFLNELSQNFHPVPEGGNKTGKKSIFQSVKTIQHKPIKTDPFTKFKFQDSLALSPKALVTKSQQEKVKFPDISQKVPQYRYMLVKNQTRSLSPKRFTQQKIQSINQVNYTEESSSYVNSSEYDNC